MRRNNLLESFLGYIAVVGGNVQSANRYLSPRATSRARNYQ